MYHCKRRQHGRCRLADGAQALAVPVRLKQYFSHTKEVPEKPPFTDDVSILKRWDNCNVEQKVAPLIPPRAVYCIQYFLEGGCGGVPRGRGEGGNLLRTLVFKLRYSRTIFFCSRLVFSAIQTFGGFCKNSAYCNDGPPAETGRPQSGVLLRSRCT